jgi:16S rRNA G966 N2-methylase RsmD
MRIITGKYKGRHFDIPRTFKARPTTDFAKENIFNVLNAYIDFDGATALDLFSGTGSITLELLSRGCASVTSVELDRDHHRFIQQCLQKLQGEANQTSNLLASDNRTSGLDFTPLKGNHKVQSSKFKVQSIRGDVFRFVKSCKQQFDFIFADPPYALRELPQIPDLIFDKQLLSPNGVFVFEHGKDHDFSKNPHFSEHRSYGSVNFSIFVSR